jgi:hypothetical protein
MARLSVRPVGGGGNRTWWGLVTDIIHKFVVSAEMIYLLYYHTLSTQVCWFISADAKELGVLEETVWYKLQPAKTSVELLFVVPVQHVDLVVRQSCPTLTMCISINYKY